MFNNFCNEWQLSCCSEIKVFMLTNLQRFWDFHQGSTMISINWHLKELQTYQGSNLSQNLLFNQLIGLHCDLRRCMIYCFWSFFLSTWFVHTKHSLKTLPYKENLSSHRPAAWSSFKQREDFPITFFTTAESSSRTCRSSVKNIFLLRKIIFLSDEKNKWKKIVVCPWAGTWICCRKAKE